jgi:hypothetical protein
MFHVACTQLSKGTCNTVKTNDSIKWFCSICEKRWNDNQICQEKIEMIWSHLTTHDKRFNEYIDNMKCLNEKIDDFSKQAPPQMIKETYAEKLKLKKNEPVVIVRPKNLEQKCIDTKKEIKAKINPTDLPVNGLRNAARGCVVIEVKDKQSTEVVRQKAAETLGDEYEVVVAKTKNPRVKIIGVYDSASKEALISSIRSQNSFISEEDTIEVIKIDKSRRHENSYNIVIELDPRTYGKVMEQSRLNIGWNRCRVIDHIYVLRCFKCEQYGHLARDCKNELACRICAQAHETKDCKSEEPKCVNCVNAMKKLNLKLEVDHPVWSDVCKVYKRIEANKKRSINYYE